MRGSIVVAGAGLLLASLTGACGDATGANTVSMTSAEANSLFATVALTLASGFLSSSGSGTSLNATVSCETSGSATVAGTFTGPANTPTSYDITTTFTNCNDSEFTISGSIKFSGTGLSSTSGTVTVKGDLTMSGSKTGTCVVDVTSSRNGGSTTNSGSVCGQSI